MLFRLLYSSRVIRTCVPPPPDATEFGFFGSRFRFGSVARTSLNRPNYSLGLIIGCRLGLIIGGGNRKKREGSFSAPHPRLVLTDGDLTAVELSCNRVRRVVSHPAEVLRDLLAEDGEHRLALLVAHLPAAVHRGRDDDLVLSEFHIEAGTGLEPVLDELVLVCQPY